MLNPNRINLSEKAYGILKSQITNGQFHPGNKIVEEEIARNLGISRTPIREALNRLERDGLITFLPYRGAYIKQLKPEDIEEIYQIRKALEGLSVVLGKDKISTDDLLRIEKSLTSCDNANNPREKFQKFIKADKVLHETIIFSSGNKRLMRILKDLYDIVQGLRVLDSRLFFRLEEAHKEHRMIFQALRKKNIQKAKLEIEKHIENAKQNLLKDFTFV